MTKKERAERARRILAELEDLGVLAEMERRAIDEFVSAHRYWWGDRRRRVAAEHISEVRDFKNRLEMVILSGVQERIR